MALLYEPEDILVIDHADKRRLEKEEHDSDIRWLMSTKKGRRFVWRTLDQCGVFRMSFNTDALLMAFAEGNRNFGNQLLEAVISTVPDMYSVMIQEHKEYVDAGK